MTSHKKLIAVAVGGTLALGMGVPAHADHDNVLLAPYVVKDTNRTTLITIMGIDGASSGPAIHLQYWTKSTTAANTAACEPSSTTLSFTDNDIVTFDTAGLLGPGPLFGDTTNAAPLGTSISYAGPRHGYLVIESISGFGGGSGTWVEVDIANGGAHGDILFGNNENGGSSDFHYAISEENKLDRGEAFSSANNSAVPFWPTSTASTVFTITPLGTNMLTSDNNTVVLQVYNNNSVQGAYDRNENGIDGTVPQTVRCIGRLTAAQLMPGVVTNAAWAASGGWGQMTNLGDNDATSYEDCSSSGDCSAVVYQVDSSNAAGTGRYMQNAIRVVSSNDRD